MTPKEKAKELVTIYWNAKVETSHVRESIMSKELAKQCALIAVDEVLEAIPNEYLDYWQGESQMVLNEDVEYWQKVKQEIEKL